MIIITSCKSLWICTFIYAMFVIFFWRPAFLSCDTGYFMKFDALWWWQTSPPVWTPLFSLCDISGWWLYPNKLRGNPACFPLKWNTWLGNASLAGYCCSLNLWELTVFEISIFLPNFIEIGQGIQKSVEWYKHNMIMEGLFS